MEELYDFLMSHETGILKLFNETSAYVYVEFWEIDEFIEISGYDSFYEGKVKGTVLPKTIAIELIYSILTIEELKKYKDCFDKDDWNKVFCGEKINENRKNNRV